MGQGGKLSVEQYKLCEVVEHLAFSRLKSAHGQERHLEE